jgi:hypothetical protein
MHALLLSALSVFGIVTPQAPATPDIHFAVKPQPLADAMLRLAHVTGRRRVRPGQVMADRGAGGAEIRARGVGI